MSSHDLPVDEPPVPRPLRILFVLLAILFTAALLVLVEAPLVASAATPPPGGHLVSIGPARVVDTRSTGGPIAANATRNIPVLGHAGIPSTNVSAVVLNVTVLSQTASGTFEIYPSGTTRPNATVQSFVANQTLATLVFVAPGSGGAVTFWNGSPGTVQVVLDVEGYVDNSGSQQRDAYASLTPTRILDTRSGLGGHLGTLAPHARLTFTVSGLPSGGFGVGGVLLFVKAISPSQFGYLTVEPHGAALSTHSVSHALHDRGNFALVGSTQVDVYNGGIAPVHVFAVLEGFTSGGAPNAQGQFVVSTGRLADTLGHQPLGARQTLIFPAENTGGVGAPAQCVLMDLTVINRSSGLSTSLKAYTHTSPAPTWSVVYAQPAESASNLALVTLPVNGNLDVDNTNAPADVLAETQGWVTG